MLIARTLQFSKLLLQSSFSLQASAPNLPLLKYQKFFRQVQKATHPQEAINIYGSYVNNKQGDYRKYLTNTLRILTRLIRKVDEKQVAIIDNFFQEVISSINAFDVSKLQQDDLKDFILFCYKYTQYVSSLRAEQQQILERFLAEYLVRFQRAKDKIALGSTLLTTIRLSSQYCPSLEQRIITRSINLLYSHQHKLVANTLTFINLLSTIRQIYHPSKPFHQQLLHSTFFLLSTKQINKEFDSYAKATILHTIIDIRQQRGVNSVVSTSLLLEEVQKSIEEMLLQEMWECNQRSLYFLITGLLKLREDNIVLREYFKIIESSIEGDGMAKVNPNIIIWAVSLLDRKNKSLMLSRSWQQRFLNMLRVYYNKNNQFVNSISSQLSTLIQKQLFDEDMNLELYYFLNNEYLFFKKERFIKTIYLYIKQTEVHAFFKNQKEVKALLGIIEKMLHQLAQSWAVNYQGYFSGFQNLHRKISMAKGIQYPQIRSVEFDHKLRVGSVDRSIHDKQLKAYLLCLELKISEYFCISEIISDLLAKLFNSNCQAQQLLLFLNYLLFRTKLSDASYHILEAGLEKVFEKNKMDLRENVYRMVMDEVLYDDSCESNIRLKREINIINFEQYKGSLLCIESLRQHVEKAIKPQPKSPR